MQKKMGGKGHKDNMERLLDSNWVLIPVLNWDIHFKICFKKFNA
jgi:hypothetical protein